MSPPSGGAAALLLLIWAPLLCGGVPAQSLLPHLYLAALYLGGVVAVRIDSVRSPSRLDLPLRGPGAQLTEEQDERRSLLKRAVPEIQEVLESCVDDEDEGRGPGFVEDTRDVEDRPSGTCKRVSKQQAIELVLFLGTLVQDGAMEKEEFLSQVDKCMIDTCTMEELEHLVQMSQLLKHDTECQMKDQQHGDGACWQSERAEEQAMLSRMAVPTEQSFERQQESLAQRAPPCTCDDDAPTIRRQELMEVVAEEKISIGPMMMREAALELCDKRGREDGSERHDKTLRSIAYFHACGRHPQSRGYCCRRPNTLREVEILQEGKSKALAKSVERITQVLDEITIASDSLESAVKQALEHVSDKQKLILIKLFAIFNHHTQLFLAMHRYCTLHPDDLEVCQDPLILARVLDLALGEVLENQRMMMGLISCVQFGARPLTEELAAGRRTSVGRLVGVARNVITRSIHFVRTGEFSRRIRWIQEDLAHTVQNYRKEIIFLSIIALVPPVTSAWTSISVFGELVRSIFLRVGCSALTSPMMTSYLIRWTMHNIMLSELFTDFVVKLFDAVVLSSHSVVSQVQLQLSATVAAKKYALRKMLHTTRTKLDDMDPMQAMEQFHQIWQRAALKSGLYEAEASGLYDILSNWLGRLWRLVLRVACSVAKTCHAAFRRSDTMAEKAGLAAESLLRRASPSDESLIAQLIGEHGATKSVNVSTYIMSQISPQAAEWIEPIVNAAGELKDGVDVHFALEALMKALTMFSKGRFVVEALSRVFTWLFSTYWDPSTFKVPNLLEDLSSGRQNFNAETCQDKKNGAQCLLLQGAVSVEGREVDEGVCCHARCQSRAEGDDQCEAGSEEAGEAQQQWDRKPTRLKNLQRQSRYLGGFIKLARRSFGDQCAELDSLAQENEEEED